MSNKYIAAAMECRVGNPTKKLILIKLADNANDDGVCWPSYATIARHCEVDKRTVIRHIKELEQMGIVSKKHRMTDKGNTSNYFQLSIPSKPLVGGGNLTLGGVTSVTRGVSPVSPGGCHPCHPEPSLEPLLEPNNVLQAKTNDADELKEALQKWNTFAESKGLKLVRGITKPRLARINTAYKNYRSIKKDLGGELKTKPEFISALVEVAEHTHRDFHLGAKGGWQMDFDYLLNKSTVEHITEHGALK